MITELITNQLHDLTIDTSTVGALCFLAFLVIYFFVMVKPGIDSRIRQNKIFQRKYDTYIANVKFYNKINRVHASHDRQKNDRKDLKNLRAVDRLSNTKQGIKENTDSRLIRKQQKNIAFYKKSISDLKLKDKGYQDFLKHNSLVSKQVVNHQKVKTASSKLNSKPVVSNKGKIQGTFIGDIPLNRKPVMPRYIGPTNSFTHKS